MNKITLLIHGPFDGNCLDDIYRSYLKVKEKIQNIIIVSYNADESNYRKILTMMNNWNVKLVIIKDIINPGFFNINRQILSVKAGLDSMKDNSFIIKLRNDQNISFKKLLKILHKYDCFEEDFHKIITTNCYTRKDRLYHPSDMFLCGQLSDIKLYYSCPLMTSTHIEHIMYLQSIADNTKKYESLILVPESYLFIHYLKLMSWNVKNTYEDSLNALQKYIFLLNTWSINLRWKKNRNPFIGSNTIILPCTFRLKPFNGVPKENAKCFQAHQINKTFPSLKDIYYICISRILFALKYPYYILFLKYYLKKSCFKLIYIMIRLLPNKLNYKLRQIIKGKIQKCKIKISQL